MKTNALVCRTDGKVEVLRAVEINGAFLRHAIGCDMFNLVRVDPSSISWLEARYGVTLFHRRRSEHGTPIPLYFACDDEGSLKHKPMNPLASVLYAAAGGLSSVCGDVVIAEVE